MNSYITRMKQTADTFLWKPIVQINISSEAIAQYMTTLGFAIIYYIGFANIFVGISLFYNLHKSILHSFPKYISDIRSAVNKINPYQIPHMESKMEEEIHEGIPNVASNPCNLENEAEADTEEVNDIIEEEIDSEEMECVHEIEYIFSNEGTSENIPDWTGEDSSENDSTEHGVRPPANSIESGTEFHSYTEETHEENLSENVDGRPRTD